MYCNDIKQLATMMRVSNLDIIVSNEQEHNALADAKWNKKAYEYLMNLATEARKDYDPFVI